MLKVVGALLFDQENKIYVCKRKNDGILGGYYEFPGGKVEKNETNEQALIREIKEECDVDIKINKFIYDNIHEYDDFSVHLFFYECEVISGTLKNIVHEKSMFYEVNKLDELNMVPGDIEIIRVLKNKY